MSSPLLRTGALMVTAAVYESLGLYRGIRHTLRHGPLIELLPAHAA